ncbi:MAG: hypothetical protein HC799_11485 [Limnothrix sp. RL_2_0]|nr:hypothetical protein [Limnothrix sp. RL_2_0]
MSDAVSSPNLHSIEQDLQQRLHEESSQSKPMQVRCVFKEGILIVLVQHGAPALPYPRRVFRVIRQFLLEAEVLQKHQVLMYLRVEGSDQPYAFHTLTEQNQQPVAATTDPVEELVAAVEPEEEAAIAPVPTDEEEVAEEESLEFATAEAEEVAAETEDYNGFDEYEEEDELGEYEDNEDLGFEGFTSADGFEGDEAAFDEVGDRRLGKAPIIFAASLALVFSGLAFYGLTRPCVIDRCETIARAEKLSEQSIKSFQSNPSGQQILTAQGQLSEAIEKLEAIPFWSPRYTEAQEQLKEYRALATSLDQVINSLYKASDAAQMSQNPPFPAEKWSEIASQWEAAIATQFNPTPRFLPSLRPEQN